MPVIDRSHESRCHQKSNACAVLYYRRLTVLRIGDAIVSISGRTKTGLWSGDTCPEAAPMDDLLRFCYLNSDSPDRGKLGARSLTVTGRYGPDKAHRMLRYRTCRA